jgi:hypothetical protein
VAYDAPGRRPFERASRSSHHHIINDGDVSELLEASWIPTAQTIPDEALIFGQPDFGALGPIEHIVAIDGSYAETVVQPNYPSSSVVFMQFGALSFRRSDLERLDRSPHPAPEDMQRLRNLERLKLALPVRGMRLSACGSLSDSIRLAVHRFFCSAEIEGVPLASTLAWLIFELYRPATQRLASWHLATDPTAPDGRGVDLMAAAMRPDFTFVSEVDAARPIYLTDVLRLHERIDEETGAGGIIGYLLNAVEQLLLMHVIRLIHQQQPAALARCLFLRDGPLAFFGQTSNLYGPFRKGLEWMRGSAQIHLVGLEKSGAFVDHARQIESRVPLGSALILGDDYIYRYIVPKDQTTADVYGRTNYYGRKVIYRTTGGGTHVATIPTAASMASPTKDDLHSFDTILACVDKLRCDMYDSALFPVALANKLVSLSAHPSQRILQRFAIGSVRG